MNWGERRGAAWARHTRRAAAPLTHPGAAPVLGCRQPWDSADQLWPAGALVLSRQCLAALVLALMSLTANVAAIDPTADVALLLGQSLTSAHRQERIGDLALISGTDELPRLLNIATATSAPGAFASSSFARPRWPRFGDNLHKDVHLALHKGYALALDRVHDTPSCRVLFADLGANPVEMLASTTYVPADAGLEKRRCRPSVAALTSVGGDTVRLCLNFSRLTAASAAVILIHEALHNAGLTEWPHDPDGLKPHEINRLVQQQCGL